MQKTLYGESQPYEKGVEKGLTLLELLVAIIIIGVLATLSVFQYMKFIERARGAEAKNILGAIRQNAITIFMANFNNCNAAVQLCNTTNVIGSDYDTSSCSPSGKTFFRYEIAATTADNLTIRATRCVPGTGKAPQLPLGATPGTVTLVTNLSSGLDTFTTSGEY